MNTAVENYPEATGALELAGLVRTDLGGFSIQSISAIRQRTKMTAGIE
jgi:hypothetical protein